MLTLLPAPRFRRGRTLKLLYYLRQCLRSLLKVTTPSNGNSSKNNNIGTILSPKKYI